MPGPLPLRGVHALHQGRFPSLDDDKVSVSMSPSQSSSSPPPSLSELHALSTNAQKHLHKESFKRMQEPVARGSHLYTKTAHTYHDVHNGSFKQSNVSTQKTDDLDSGSHKHAGLFREIFKQSNAIMHGDNLDDGSSKLGSSDKETLKPNNLPALASMQTMPSKNTSNLVIKDYMREDSPSLQAGSSINEDEFLCLEVGGRGARWQYALKQRPGKKGGSVFNVINTEREHNPFGDLMAFVRSCIVPEGYPDSVAPSYTPYMRWRALKYLFGGAMSVFTTRSLLHAVGVAKHGASAMAVNWVIKDGAGRVGKLLFARHGKKFDYDMKQLRFTGDLLMEIGAAVELATVSAPHLFLPFACAANLAKNVAAVASTSTRAPIYKSFTRGENIGDVTAKGECISNVADLLGTGLGIFISKKNPSLMVTFALLSCGYLCCSYNEIKSVCLPTLNRSRFKVAVQFFLETGRVPSLFEVNEKESIFTPPWAKEKPFALGARINEAFQCPYKFHKLLPSYKNENYLVTYNPIKRQAFALLKEKASSEDVLKATFHAQVLEHVFQGGFLQGIGRGTFNGDMNDDKAEIGIDRTIRESCETVPRLFESFKKHAVSQGWIMGESMLNPGIVRLSV